MSKTRFTLRQQMQVQTTVVRDKAEALLDGLLRTQQASERQHKALPSLNRDRTEVAHLALARAITSTRQMIERLNRVVDPNHRV